MTLLTATPREIDALEERSQVVCVVYRDHLLPEGVSPPTGDLGLETSGDVTHLHLRLGHVYCGEDEEVRGWVTSGTVSFKNFQECIDWFRTRWPGGVNDVDPLPGLRGWQSRPKMSGQSAEEAVDPGRTRVGLEDALSVAGIEAALSRSVLGQDSALRSLAELVAYHVAKPHPRRPASGLLVGETGTGKTLAAEELASYLSQTAGSEWSYCRLDMNEFSEPHSVARLFGAPPGYLGYADGNNLATTLRENPRTVIVFDEIDKAHPQLWRSLMNLMDAGRIGGPSADSSARRAILLFTSNKDAAEMEPMAEEPDNQLRTFLRDYGYPPEIVARMGRILVFKTLSQDVMARLVVLTVQRVTESFGLQLNNVDARAVRLLARSAPHYRGVRDIEYFVERTLAPQLATHTSHSGASICIDADLNVI